MWQSDGQCWMRTVHDSAEAGRLPSSASVAVPENEIGSPTFHLSVESGAWITGTGGELLTEMVIALEVVDARWLSVTRRRTLYEPGVWYVKPGLGLVESPKTPSPFRSQEYEIVSPGSGSLEVEPSNATVSGALPLVGVAVALAIGGRFPPRYLISRIVPPTMSA